MLLLPLNNNWDIVLFSAPVADVIYLFIYLFTYLFIISVHAANSIKLKLLLSFEFYTLKDYKARL